MDEKEIYGRNYYRKMLNPSFLDKLKKEIDIVKLSEQEVKAMKKLLIVAAKPIFLESTKDKFLENYFNERIETLSKRNIYQLYNLFIDYKKLIGTVYEDFARSIFITTMKFTYAEDRWEIRKTIDLLESSFRKK